MYSSLQERHQSSDSAQRSQCHAQQRRRGGRQRAHGKCVFRCDLDPQLLLALVLQSNEVAFFLKLFKCPCRSPQAPNSSESPGTSRTEHSDLLEEEEDERSDIKVTKKTKTVDCKQQREWASVVDSAMSIKASNWLCQTKASYWSSKWRRHANIITWCSPV